MSKLRPTVSTPLGVQVFTAVAEVSQQRGSAGGVYHTLLQRFSNQKHYESDGEGNGAHPSEPQRDPVCRVGCH